MAIYDLYGSISGDLSEARKLLEASLGIEFETRHGEYQGGQYFHWGRAEGEHFLLKKNIDCIDGGPAEMGFPECRILLYINDTPNSSTLQDKIRENASDFVLMRREDLE